MERATWTSRHQSNRIEPLAHVRQRGAAIVETVIALPILLAIILGSIQFGLIYRAKATLNFAGLQAARAGAVDHARPEAIRTGLARGLAPLYSPDSSVEGVARTIERIHAALVADARVRIASHCSDTAGTRCALKVAGTTHIKVYQWLSKLLKSGASGESRTYTALAFIQRPDHILLATPSYAGLKGVALPDPRDVYAMPATRRIWLPTTITY